MRPNSIRWFDRLFLTALALGTAGSIANANSTVTRFAANPATADFGMGFLVWTIVGTTVMNLLIWFFISRRASNVAKWLFILVLGTSLSALRFILTGSGAYDMGVPMKGLTLINFALNVAATVMLFRPDARAWFARRGKAVDASVFD
jgi:hypothetical protein